MATAAAAAAASPVGPAGSAAQAQHPGVRVEEFKAADGEVIVRVSFMRANVSDEEFAEYLSTVEGRLRAADRCGHSLHMEFNLRPLSTMHMLKHFMTRQLRIFGRQQEFLEHHAALFRRTVHHVTMYEPSNFMIASAVRRQAKKHQLVPTTVVRFRDVVME